MRYRNRSVPATGWRDKRIIGSMNDERRHGDGRQTRATVARHGDRGDLSPCAAKIVGALYLLQHKAAMGLIVKQTVLAGNAACESNAMR